MNASPPATTNATPLTQIGITVSPTMTRTPRTTRNSCARDTTARRIVAVTVAGVLARFGRIGRRFGPMVDQLARQDAKFFLNISASPFNAGKRKSR